MCIRDSTYEIADHGALIAATEFGSITKKMVYSWDHGATWKSLVIPPSEVTNIITQPQSSSQQFVALCRKISYGDQRTDQSTLVSVSYTHLRAHETVLDLVCRLLLEKKKNKNITTHNKRNKAEL
eukprot:TRINITY_DN3017_c0_g1_i1.p1 TRINITY_DN3017_c0_g1~~TRINITY_DN3017_c0_g1_i1.p1  ORF type:complete len:125 (-),score=49.09 TRINITY_DN3017_c0_g1_i1:42-416(-)